MEKSNRMDPASFISAYLDEVYLDAKIQEPLPPGPESSVRRLDTFPAEILDKIFSKFGPYNLLTNIRPVCKHFMRVVDDNTNGGKLAGLTPAIWERICLYLNIEDCAKLELGHEALDGLLGKSQNKALQKHLFRESLEDGLEITGNIQDVMFNPIFCQSTARAPGTIPAEHTHMKITQHPLWAWLPRLPLLCPGIFLSMATSPPFLNITLKLNLRNIHECFNDLPCIDILCKAPDPFLRYPIGVNVNDVMVGLKRYLELELNEAQITLLKATAVYNNPREWRQWPRGTVHIPEGKFVLLDLLVCLHIVPNHFQNKDLIWQPTKVSRAGSMIVDISIRPNVWPLMKVVLQIQT